MRLRNRGRNCVVISIGKLVDLKVQVSENECLSTRQKKAGEEIKLETRVTRMFGEGQRKQQLCTGRGDKSKSSMAMIGLDTCREALRKE